MRCSKKIFTKKAVSKLAPIAVVMLPEAFAFVFWRSIWTESGTKVSTRYFVPLLKNL